MRWWVGSQASVKALLFVTSETIHLLVVNIISLILCSELSIMQYLFIQSMKQFDVKWLDEKGIGQIQCQIFQASHWCLKGNLRSQLFITPLLQNLMRTSIILNVCGWTVTMFRNTNLIETIWKKNPTIMMAKTKVMLTKPPTVEFLCRL